MNEIQIISECEVHVILGGGHVAKCDLHTWNEKLCKHRWRAQVHQRGHIYAYTLFRGFPIGMHRLVMNVIKRSQIVDHINRDGLDNRRVNLRFATSGQNRANSRRERHNESGYKGVSWSETSKKWTAKLAANGKRYYMGVFVDKVRAAMAVDRKALEVHGEYAGLNFEHLRHTYRVPGARP